MLVKYIVCGPVVGAVCCATLLIADVALVPALVVSWLLGSLAVGALAAYAAYCSSLSERQRQADREKASQSAADNSPSSG